MTIEPDAPDQATRNQTRIAAALAYSDARMIEAAVEEVLRTSDEVCQIPGCTCGASVLAAAIRLALLDPHGSLEDYRQRLTYDIADELDKAGYVDGAVHLRALAAR